MNEDRLANLELENARLREELWYQWEFNHSEHCSNVDWPHPEGEDCHWRVPPILEPRGDEA